MKSYRKELWFNIPSRRGFVNITLMWRLVCEKSGVKKGCCSASHAHHRQRFINDNESGLHQDFEKWLEKLAPKPLPYAHQHGEDNADAHLKRTIMGREAVVAITNGDGLRSVGTNLLRRIRRQTPQARARQDHRE